jgi:hypothetical protein
LIGFDLDPSAVGGLKKAGIGRGDTAPAKGVEVGRKVAGKVKTPAGHPVPVHLFQKAGIDLALPKHLQCLALGVVLQTGKAQKSRIFLLRRQVHALHKVLTGADTNDVTGLGKHAEGSGRRWTLSRRGKQRKVKAGSPRRPQSSQRERRGGGGFAEQRKHGFSVY